MKLLTLWIAAMGVSGMLSPAAVAQEAAIPLGSPTKASVVTKESGRLVPGDKFHFQLRLDRAPDHLGGGEIMAEFQREGEPSLSKFFAGIGEGETSTVSTRTELHDGQATYEMELPVTETMPPGKWELSAVYVGRSNPKTVPVSNHASFDISELSPITIHIQAPASVEAGKQYTVTVSVDKYPTDFDKDCKVNLTVRLKQASPNGRIVGLGDANVRPDQLSYKFHHFFEPDFPSGPWQVEVAGSAASVISNAIGCRLPQLKGDVRFPFKIEPSKTLVMPTSVAVTVNPSQIELLLGEADRLRAKAKQLQSQLSSDNPTEKYALLLQTGVDEALKDLGRTETNFKEKSLESSSPPEVDVFFGDIRLSYRDALKALAGNSAYAPQTGPTLERLSAVIGGGQLQLQNASNAVLASILHNAEAYEVVASTKAITFTLYVYSQPRGANIFYKLRGDDYHQVEHETDWQIENLTRAVYFIRLQKVGCKDEEREFDAIRNATTSLRIDLKCSKGPR